jgi:hypothetical protein
MLATSSLTTHRTKPHILPFWPPNSVPIPRVYGQRLLRSVRSCPPSKHLPSISTLHSARRGVVSGVHGPRPQPVLFPALTQIPPAFTSIHFWLDLSLLLCLRPAAAAVCAAVHLSSASALPILPQRPIGRLRQVRRPLIGRQHTQTCLSSTERSSLARPVSRATV